jgi:hypothetical protein
LFILVIGGVVVSTLIGGPSGLLIGGVIILLIVPGLQVVAAIVTVIILAVSERVDKRFQFEQLGRIVLGVIAGSFIGLALMFLLFLGLSR